MKLAVVALVLLVGCHDLPEIDQNVCGNFVLDPGEDCDEGPDTDNGANDCERCSLRCTEDGFCRPDDARFAGYTCGVDGFCQAPSGNVGELSATIPLATTTFEITDIDHDAIGDVVALTSTSVTVNFGDEQGFLERQTSTLTPTIQGTPAFATLDGDTSRDLILPTTDGIVAYSSPFGVLAPHAFSIDLTKAPPSCNNPVQAAFFVFAVDNRRLGVLYAMAGQIRIAIIDGLGHDACAEMTAKICDGALAGPDQVTAYTTRQSSTSERVFAVTTTTGVCVGTVRQEPDPLDTDKPYTIRSLTPTPLAFTGIPVLADLGNTTCPSVIDSSQGATALREYLGFRNGSACQLASAPSQIHVAASYAGATVVGSVPLSPSISGACNDALVLTTGIVAVDFMRSQVASSFIDMYKADRILFGARSGDFDGDGDIDVVALGIVPSPSGPVPTEDLDVLYRATAPDLHFLRYRVDTRAPVSTLSTGDFDGNGIDDITFSEVVPPGQRVSLAYGTSDRVLAPVESAAFAFVVGLVPLQANDSSDPSGLVDDLGIVDLVGVTGPGTGRPRFTLLHGSTQRTLISFFDPRPTGATDSRFVSVAAYETQHGAHLANLVAVEQIGQQAKGWPLTNVEGNLEFTVGRELSQFGSCPGTVDGTFCSDRARYVAWSIGAHDVVIGIDPPGDARVAVIDPTTGTSADPLAVARSTVFDDVTLGVTALHVADTDGDGESELVVAFGAMSDQGDVRICKVGASGVPESCASLAALAPELAGATCSDAAPANLVARGALDAAPPPGQPLVALCRNTEGLQQLWQLVPDGHAGFVATALAIEDDVSAVVRVQAGDVTGDGLDDLLLIRQVPAESTTQLLVYPQCPARDATCRTPTDEDPP